MALADRRRHNPGPALLLTVAQQREIQQALEHAPQDGGHWTGAKVARWIAAKTGKKVHRQRGYE